MLDKLTKESFLPHLNSIFQFQIGPSATLALELVEVTGLGSGPVLTNSQSSRERFAIVFRGPHSPMLPQHMYRVEHEAIGAIDDLFIVPVGQTAEGILYEAVFN